MANLTQEEQLKIIADLEIEMIGDMFNRMSKACKTKCVLTKYNESELSKGESVCIDRCVAKYLEIHDRIGKKISNITMQNQSKGQQ